MLQERINELGDVSQLVVIADQTVADLHLDRLIEGLNPEPLVLTFPPGEASKCLETASALYDALARSRIERGAVIVAFGGGVAGDLAGFVAATWLRGVRCIQVPTTVLAAVDASVGGKTGVNLPDGKNLVGVFHQPVAVVVDTGFLETLSERDFCAGLAESVKHAAIRDAAFFAWHEAHVEAIKGRGPGAVAELVARNCEIKADVVAQDEREAGLRAILNYGHTIGHAIEHQLGYALRHGECVGLGMVAENALAQGRGTLQPGEAERIRDLVEALGLPTRLPALIAAEDVIAACRLDKKVRGGAIRAVLVRKIGEPEQVAGVGEEEIAGALPVIQPA